METHPIENVQRIPVELIDESPTNPRKIFPAMEELVASVRAKGILQPVLVRPTAGGRYELCYGHRRRRAALEAGLYEIPALVRELSDEELVEAQLVENIQRQDITALEEADSYANLMARGYTGEQIVEKTGKTKAHVYARAKLAKLGKFGRDAVHAGKLGAEAALLVARLPDKVQKEAVHQILEQELETFREVKEFIFDRIFRQLRNAKWSLDDAALVPDAGACSSCPKSSLGDPALKVDPRSADVCTDVGCFDRKTDALFKLRIKEVKQAGGRVLDKATAEKVLPWPWSDAASRQHGYYSLAEHVTPDKTLRQIVQESGASYTPVIARRTAERNGREVEELVELADAKEVEGILKGAGIKVRKDPSQADYREAQKRQNEKAAKKDAERAERLGRIFEVLAAQGLPRWLVEELLKHRWYLIPDSLRKGRMGEGAAVKKATPDNEVLALVAVGEIAGWSNGSMKSLDELVGRFGLEPSAEAPAESAPAGVPPVEEKTAKARPAKKTKTKGKGQGKAKPKAKRSEKKPAKKAARKGR